MLLLHSLYIGLWSWWWDMKCMMCSVLDDDGCGTCTSAACVSASAVMIASMDPTVDPCQDFYQYACGRWIRMNPIPSGKPIWGTFDRLWQDNQIVMKTILGKIEMRIYCFFFFVCVWPICEFSVDFDSEQPAESVASEAEKRAQRYYQSCLDVNETMESLGGKPVLDLLVQIGGWTAIQSPDEDHRRWNFQKALQTAHNVMNMGGFFTWAVAEDDKNSSRHVIQVWV